MVTATLNSSIFWCYLQQKGGENSDLDIMVEFNDKIGIRFMDLANDLEKLIELKVDLISRKGIKKRCFQLKKI